MRDLNSVGSQLNSEDVEELCGEKLKHNFLDSGDDGGKIISRCNCLVIGSIPEWEVLFLGDLETKAYDLEIWLHLEVVGNWLAERERAGKLRGITEGAGESIMEIAGVLSEEGNKEEAS